MWPKIVVPKDILFSHKLHRNSSPHCCQSSCARVPSESRAHFNIYWNVIKTTQSDSRQSMLFRLCAAQAGLHALATIVCLHAIRPHPSEGKMLESHLCNSCLSEEWLSLDCMLTEYIYPSMCFNWQSIYSEQGRALQEHVKEHLTLCCIESLPCSICLYYFWHFNHLPISTVSHHALQKQHFDWWRSSDRLIDSCSEV